MKQLLPLLLLATLSMTTRATEPLDTNRIYQLAGAAQKYLVTDLDSMAWVVNELDQMTANRGPFKERALALVIQGEYLKMVNEFDSALVLFEECSAIYNDLDDYKNAARTKLRIAQTLEWLNRMDEAIAMKISCVQLFEEAKDTHALATAYDNLGYSYMTINQYNKSIEQYLKAKDLRAALGDQAGVASAYNTIGLNYRQLLDREKEVSNLEMAYETIQGIPDSLHFGLISCNLGETYLYINKEEEGFKLLQDAERILQNLNHVQGLTSTYHAYVKYFNDHAEDQVDKAIEYASKSKELCLRVKNYRNLTQAQRLLGKLYNKQGKTALALAELKDAFDMSVEQNFIHMAQKSSILLSQILEKKGDFKQSLYYHQQHMAYNDSVFNKDKVEELKEIELTYDFEQQRMADSLQVIQDQQAAELAHQQELAGEQQSKNILFFVLALIGLTAGFAFLAYRRQRKQNTELDTQKKLVEEALHEKQLLLKEVHHRVKNNFQIVSSLLELQSKGIEDEKARELAEEGQNRVKSMALIHQRLYQNDDLLIHFDEYIGKLVDEIADMYGEEQQAKIDLKIPNLAFDIDTAIPLGLIVNELVTNAFKYGLDKEESNLSIRLAKAEDASYELVVTDSGKGLPEGFDLAKAKSLGLRLVRRLAKQLQGSFSYQFQEGASFAVRFKDTSTRAAGA